VIQDIGKDVRGRRYDNRAKYLVARKRNAKFIRIIILLVLLKGFVSCFKSAAIMDRSRL
jgi:hypothetical protein